MFSLNALFQSSFHKSLVEGDFGCFQFRNANLFIKRLREFSLFNFEVKILHIYENFKLCFYF